MMTMILGLTSSCSWRNGKGLSSVDIQSSQTWLLTRNNRSATDEGKPVSLQKDVDIPHKPKPAPAAEPHPETNGVSIETNGDSSKRKRDAEEADLGNGDQRAKRFAAASDDADSSRPIVLDDAADGAILIDDDWSVEKFKKKQ